MENIVKERHSVRNYTDKKIEGDIAEELKELINECNIMGNLSIKLFLNEPKAFNTKISQYGNFINVKNYIVMSGKKSNDLGKKCGYYGERIVLEAQKLGLNTCWVGLTYDKKNIPCKFEKNEKISIVIAIGYGINNGVSHHIKSFKEVSATKNNVPDWYKKGIEYALFAPTAMNLQMFKFRLFENNEVKLTTRTGFFSKIDLGIIKYHFELGVGQNDFKWIN